MKPVLIRREQCLRLQRKTIDNIPTRLKSWASPSRSPRLCAERTSTATSPLAIAAAVELAISHGFPVTPKSIADGIRNTRWPARLERHPSRESGHDHKTTEFILDVAHNPAGAWALRAGLRDMLPGRHLGTLVFSCLRDKPVVEMAHILFPIFDQVIFAPIHSSRATPVRDLLAAAASTGTPAFAASSVKPGH